MSPEPYRSPKAACYTFNSLNGTTTHPNVTYAPGNLSMAPIALPTPYQVLYGHHQQAPQFNTFTKLSNTNNAMPTDTTSGILDQIAKLLASRNTTNHQLQEIQTTAPTAGNMFDMTVTPKSSQEDDSQE